MNWLDIIYDALASENIFISEIIQYLPGKWQRFNSSGHHKRNLNAYVFIHGSGKFALIGDHSKHDSPIKVILNSNGSVQDKHAFWVYKEERNIYYKKANQAATAIWNDASLAEETHPYILRKKIKPWFIKQSGNALILPMLAGSGDIVGIQKIYPNGAKFFVKGSILKGSFLILGHQSSNTMRICEGYATGMSLFLATDDIIFVAFTASNLREVAKYIKKKYPSRIILICADPKQKEISSAILAARSIGCTVHAPARGLLDYNDIHVKYGIEALQGVIYQNWCNQKIIKRIFYGSKSS